MQISSRFTIAVHIFACIDTFEKDHKITSDFLAASVNVNPVIIRKLLSQLKNAGLIQVKRGSGGASFSRPLEDITLLDIYRAVDDKLDRIQNAMEREMASITMADVIEDTKKYIGQEAAGC